MWKLIPPEKSAGTKSSHHTAAPQWQTEGGLSYFFSAGPFSPSVPAAAWVDEYNAFTYFNLSFNLQRSRDWIASVSNVSHLSAAEGLGRQVGVLSGPVLMGTATLSDEASSCKFEGHFSHSHPFTHYKNQQLSQSVSKQPSLCNTLHLFIYNSLKKNIEHHRNIECHRNWSESRLVRLETNSKDFCDSWRALFGPHMNLCNIHAGLVSKVHIKYTAVNISRQATTSCDSSSSTYISILVPLDSVRRCCR